MGRQIQICTTDIDNRFFESYLRSNFECTFFQPSAPSLDKLEITTFAETSFPFSTQIFIWNKAFAWTPEFKQTVTQEKTFYITNTSNAPLIEFNKTLWNEKDSHGRIYWTKYFTAGPIEYDLKKFEFFYDTITKWFVKNSKGKI
jgi:hypothetical protein